jgi:hypothetical protein
VVFTLAAAVRHGVTANQFQNPNLVHCLRHKLIGTRTRRLGDRLAEHDQRRHRATIHALDMPVDDLLKTAVPSSK